MDAVALFGALFVNFAIIMTAMLALWLVALAIKDVSFVDAFWAYGMIVLAGASFGQAYRHGPLTFALLALVTIWGARLGTHLLLRWCRRGPDPRYMALLRRSQEQGGSFAFTSLTRIFLLQGPLLFLVSLPAQLAILTSADRGWTPLALLGAALALTGIACESVADWQLARFRDNPANKDKVLQTGLWQYSRHPNYFGDALTWWGVWLIAAQTPYGLWTLPGPLFLTWTLAKWSGAPILETSLRKSRPGYAAYVARTSAFIPWPPRSQT